MALQVLHHISSAARREALLRELARLLRPGGRALITAWATEQEDPGKLAKWEPIVGHSGNDPGDEEVSRPPFSNAKDWGEGRDQQVCSTQGSRVGASAGSGGAAAQGAASPPCARHGVAADDAAPDTAPRQAGPVVAAVACPESRTGLTSEKGADHNAERTQNPPAQDCVRPAETQSNEASRTSRLGAGGSSNNYFVPWHLPFHRAEAAAAVAAAHGSSGAGGAGVIDKIKGTVVFKRFYHLFEPGELEGLVAVLPGVELADAFFDKSNWCVVISKL